MKICFLVDSIFSIGGVQRVTAVIAKALAKQHDVTIVTFDSQDCLDTSLYGLEEADIRYRFFHYPPVGYWKNMISLTSHGLSYSGSLSCLILFDNRPFFNRL